MTFAPRVIFLDYVTGTVAFSYDASRVRHVLSVTYIVERWEVGPDEEIEEVYDQHAMLFDGKAIHKASLEALLGPEWAKKVLECALRDARMGVVK